MKIFKNLFSLIWKIFDVLMFIAFAVTITVTMFMWNITAGGVVIKQKRNADKSIDIDMDECRIRDCCCNDDVRFIKINCRIINILKLNIIMNGIIL